MCTSEKCGPGCRVAAVEKAEAEKIQVVKAAEGDAESKYLQGQVLIHTCQLLLYAVQA